MPTIILQNNNGDKNVYYEFNTDEKPLGKGGMGRVFKGKRIDKSTGLKRDVAIKLMFDDLPNQVIERARREASIRILNENLVEMIDFVEVEEKNEFGLVLATHYHVVSEFLDGVNLDELLKGKTDNHDGGPNPFAEKLYKQYRDDRPRFVANVFRHILSGIMALHYAGYIHRDIDPSNIMVTVDGKIKLIDFGIARDVGSLRKEQSLTKMGQFLGKPYYAAPELILGDLTHQDFRTDIYALGIMLFKLTTGHLPFDGPMLEVSEKQLHTPLPLREIKDPKVKKIIAKATEKKQEKRYQTAAEMLVDIDKWMASGTGDSDNHLLKGLAIAAGIVAIAVVGAVAFNKINNSKTANQVSEPIAQEEKSASIVEEETIDTISLAPIVEVVKNVAEAERLMMDENTASDGWAMLNELVAENDYDAVFLKSRILFDPGANGKDTMFYDHKWATMRANAGLNADKYQSHELLMKACTINKDDYAVLFQLGCDFQSGNRGCTRHGGYAKWFFEEAQEALKAVEGDDAERYTGAIEKQLASLKKTKKENPFSGQLDK